MSSPTQRSLEYLRERGWMAHVVERWIPFKHIRVDCFGGDILAIHPASQRTMLIQATSATNHSSRSLKSRENDKVAHWLRAGNEFQVWSWKKGKKEPRVENIQLSDLQSGEKERELAAKSERA